MFDVDTLERFVVIHKLHAVEFEREVYAVYAVGLNALFVDTQHQTFIGGGLVAVVAVCGAFQLVDIAVATCCHNEVQCCKEHKARYS